MYMGNAQAYERQVEELTRALTSGDESQADAAKERAALLQQLHGAEQVTRANPAIPVLEGLTTEADTILCRSLVVKG